MSTFGAIFVELPEPSEQAFDEIHTTLKKQGFLFTLRYHETKPWAQVWVDESENVPYYSNTLSGIFSERRVIGISCQSVVDAIGYWDLLGGQTQRVLEYGFQQERTWEKVEGTPQEWETQIFEDREGYQPGASPKVGSTKPFFSNFDVQAVGKILGLPGFGTPALGEKWTKEIIN